MKFFHYVGVGVACLFAFSSCVGSGSQQPLAQGKLTNPADIGFMVGYEVPKISDRWSRTFGLYKMFEVGDPNSPPPSSDYATQPGPPGTPQQPQIMLAPTPRSWLPWDTCSIFTPRAGDNDINCDGRVDDADVQLYRRFQGQNPPPGYIGEPNPETR